MNSLAVNNRQPLTYISLYIDKIKTKFTFSVAESNTENIRCMFIYRDKLHYFF